MKMRATRTAAPTASDRGKRRRRIEKELPMTPTASSSAACDPSYWCQRCGAPIVVDGTAPPAWVYPLKVRAVGPREADRDTFVDPMRIVYGFRGKHACPGGAIEAPFVGDAWLRPEAWYVRTAEGLFRLVGRTAIEQIAKRLPPTFAQAVSGGVLINMKVVPTAWDGPATAHVRRIGYALRSPAGRSQIEVEWIRISRGCLPDILRRFT